MAPVLKAYFCGVAQYGAAWLSMVRRGSVWCGVAQLWCGVAQHGAAWLSMVRRGSEWCGVAQMVRRGSVGSASACCKAGPSSILGSAPQGGSPTEQTSDEEMERGLSEWRRMNVIV
jgi:hypothetical protein